MDLFGDLSYLEDLSYFEDLSYLEDLDNTCNYYPINSDNEFECADIYEPNQNINYRRSKRPFKKKDIEKKDIEKKDIEKKDIKKNLHKKRKTTITVIRKFTSILDNLFTIGGIIWITNDRFNLTETFQICYNQMVEQNMVRSSDIKSFEKRALLAGYSHRGTLFYKK